KPRGALAIPCVGGGFRSERRGVTNSYMQPLCTVVALGAAPARAAARFDAAACACDLLPFGEDLFARIKHAEAGAMVLLLTDESDDPALAGAAKAGRILERRRG